MRITIGDYVLCEGRREVQYPRDWAGSTQQDVDPRKLFRASAAKPTGRGNRVTPISFGVHRIHGSHRAACEFIVSHLADMPETGVIAFQFEDEAGGVTVYYLTDGQVVGVTWPPVVGVSTYLTYSLTGGVFTATKPTA